MRTSILTASILTCLGLMSSTVSHASRTARTVEAPELAAGTWTSAQTGRAGSASVSIELASTSIVVPTVSTEAPSTVVFTSETGRRTRATAGESLELEAGSYTMDVSVESRDAATVGAYAAPLNDLTIQRHVTPAGETGATTIGVNPELISSEMIQALIGGPAIAANIILTDTRFRLMVEGTDVSIMIEYTPETGEGRIGYGEPTYGGEGYGGTNPEDWVRDHGLDPQDLVDFQPGEVFTGDTDAIGSEFADQTFALIDRMLAMGEQMDQLGRVEGWLSEALMAWAQYYYGNEGFYADKNDDGVMDGFDWGPNGDMDGDGILNKDDDDDDNDGVKDWDDRFPNDPAYSIWAQSEGGVLMLTDSPVADIGDVDRTFDIQVEVILDDLDALEDFGAMVGGRY